MRIIVRRRQAEQVFGRLLLALKRREYPYDRAILPEAREHLPRNIEWGSKMHAVYLFLLCLYMKGGIKSYIAAQSLAFLCEDHPDLFDARKAGDKDQGELAALLRAYGLGYGADEAARHWVENMRRLDNLWGGHPARIFDGVKTFRESCRRIQNRGGEWTRDGLLPRAPYGFLGFQEKMVSMITYFLMTTGFIDAHSHPVPVDFHVLRSLVANRILVVRDAPDGNHFSPKLLASARSVSMWYCRKHGVDPLELCQALWLLGSEICHLHPGNSSVEGERNGRRTPLAPREVVWDDTQTRRYERSCRICPVNGTCSYNIPQANYYRQGKPVIRSERESPPQQSMLHADPREARDYSHKPVGFRRHAQLAALRAERRQFFPRAEALPLAVRERAAPPLAHLLS